MSDLMDGQSRHRGCAQKTQAETIHPARARRNGRLTIRAAVTSSPVENSWLCASSLDEV